MKEIKYTFKNGAFVIAPNIEAAYEAIKREYGIFIPVVKREVVKCK